MQAWEAAAAAACADLEERQDAEMLRAVEAAETLMRLRSQLEQSILSKLEEAEAAMRAKRHQSGAVMDPLFQAKQEHLQPLVTLQRAWGVERVEQMLVEVGRMLKTYDIAPGGTPESHFDRQLRYNMRKHTRPNTPPAAVPGGRHSPESLVTGPGQLQLMTVQPPASSTPPAVKKDALRHCLRAARNHYHLPPHERSGHWTLNKKQYQAAVALPSVMVLVTAGPGTGKTETTGARIAHLLALGVQPDKIRGISFTCAAADEVRPSGPACDPRPTPLASPPR